MTLSSEQLYKFAKSCWPDNIKLTADQSIRGGCKCEPSLNDIYKVIETRFSPKDDWKQLAIWSFHQALTETLEMEVADGQEYLKPNDVKFGKFDRMMRFNLSDDAWASIRDTYK